MDNFAKFLSSSCYICSRRKTDVICDRCFNSLIPTSERFSLDIALYKYNETASKILLMSKYPPYNFYTLKYLIRRSILDFSFTADTLLCPIPISSLKMFERKFNQADLISTEFAKKLGVSSHEILKRKTDTKPLFSLGKRQRELELEDIFRPTRLGKFLANKFQNIVLVDDLRTTGETLRQAKQALATAGYKDVKSLTLFTT